MPLGKSIGRVYSVGIARRQGSWLDAGVELLTWLKDTQEPAIEQAAGWCAETIAADGLVHLFGSGHSRIPVEEMFPRYGSFPGFAPMVELSTTFHTQVAGANGQRQAMFIERVSGLADQVLANYALDENDLVIIFSVGGSSALPIEMAQGVRRAGVRVIAVTNVQSDGALQEHADLVIDLGVPDGDALIQLSGLEYPVGPGSSLSAVAIVNEIKCRTAEKLLEKNKMLPVLTSASLIGEQRKTEIFSLAYDEHARRMSMALRKTSEAPYISATVGTP